MRSLPWDISSASIWRGADLLCSRLPSQARAGMNQARPDSPVVSTAEGFPKSLFHDGLFRTLRRSLEPLLNLAKRQRVNDRASDLHFKAGCYAGSAVVPAKNANGERRGFIQRFGLNLDGMTQPLRVHERHVT